MLLGACACVFVVSPLTLPQAFEEAVMPVEAVRAFALGKKATAPGESVRNVLHT